jgi:hypothetical protein
MLGVDRARRSGDNILRFIEYIYIPYMSREDLLVLCRF